MREWREKGCERWRGTHSEVGIVVLVAATQLVNEIADLEAVRAEELWEM